jgi:uncharacterized membrane protein
MKRMVLAVLALMGLGVASYLSLYKLEVIGTLSCSIGSCETVNTSRWAVVLGVPVALWGFGFYLVLFATTLLSVQPRWGTSLGISKAILALTAWGVLFSAWLTGLELFVIHAICQWCVISAIIVTVMFGVSIAEYRETASAEEQEPSTRQAPIEE